MANNQKHRRVVFYVDYFQAFFEGRSEKLKAKIIWTLELIEQLPVVPESYLKHIVNSNGLYEVRIQSGNDRVRIFCFFDQGQILVILSGFQKKSQKTPLKEIVKALKLKSAYESTKKNSDNTGRI